MKKTRIILTFLLIFSIFSTAFVLAQDRDREPKERELLQTITDKLVEIRETLNSMLSELEEISDKETNVIVEPNITVLPPEVIVNPNITFPDEECEWEKYNEVIEIGEENNFHFMVLEKEKYSEVEVNKTLWKFDVVCLQAPPPSSFITIPVEIGLGVEGFHSEFFGNRLLIGESHIWLKTIVKHNSDESTRGQIRTTDNIILGECLFDDLNCQFENPIFLEANTEYDIIADGMGNTVARVIHRDTPLPIPQLGLYSWTVAYNAGIIFGNNFWTFTALVISTSGPADPEPAEHTINLNVNGESCISETLTSETNQTNLEIFDLCNNLLRGGLNSLEVSADTTCESISLESLFLETSIKQANC